MYYNLNFFLAPVLWNTWPWTKGFKVHTVNKEQDSKIAAISMLDDTEEQYHFSFGWCEEQTKGKWNFVLLYTHTHTHIKSLTQMGLQKWLYALRALAALGEDLGLIPSTHIKDHNCNSRGFNTLQRHRPTCRQIKKKTHTQKYGIKEH